MNTNLQIRPMIPQDWKAVKRIYKIGMESGKATFETKVPDWEQWDQKHLDIGRLVAILDQKVVGWIALSATSTRQVYFGVAEISVYIDPDFRKRGIARKLLEEVIKVSEEEGFWTLQSSIFRENHASYQLHKSLGFREIGYREKVAKRDGVWKDNILLERRSNVIGLD
ncbi:GNAT family N-acetyltransferase [Aquimarina sp. ERC-38]|uniref:GNAT family N-acetyltransferase n=1 Tax=Aquimarina sp. ERC-38 TaxID=2949996 RepID=UPI002245291A|nr:GNAT family N-acetyltransferase [Aquimarina sp. ERC-38]UZO80411.1 GNAT family N-acetyltransferase [Aquimarina sp. ERC-38]